MQREKKSSHREKAIEWCCAARADEPWLVWLKFPAAAYHLAAETTQPLTPHAKATLNDSGCTLAPRRTAARVGSGPQLGPT